jgi:hypothetical protein
MSAFWPTVDIERIFQTFEFLDSSVLPMLIVSAAAYTQLLCLDSSFAWLATPSTLAMLIVA